MTLCRADLSFLWVGMGFQRGVDRSMLEAAILQSGQAHGIAIAQIVGVATVDRKMDEVGLVELCHDRGWQVRYFSATTLQQVVVPHPSTQVQQAIGSASVAEAAALLASQLDCDRHGAEQKILDRQGVRAIEFGCDAQSGYVTQLCVPKQIIRCAVSAESSSDRAVKAVTIAMAHSIQSLANSFEKNV